MRVLKVRSIPTLRGPRLGLLVDRWPQVEEMRFERRTATETSWASYYAAELDGVVAFFCQPRFWHQLPDPRDRREISVTMRDGTQVIVPADSSPACWDTLRGLFPELDVRRVRWADHPDTFEHDQRCHEGLMTGRLHDQLEAELKRSAEHRSA